MTNLEIARSRLDRAVWPYKWVWGTVNGKYPELGKRKGQRCRIMAKKRRGSDVLIQFEDGKIFRTSMMGIRKR